jgi:hypothetical protein
MTMKKVSLNKNHPDFDLFKAGLSFRSTDGTLEHPKKAYKYHTLGGNQTVMSSDVPNGVLIDDRFVVEDVKNTANTKKE